MFAKGWFSSQHKGTALHLVILAVLSLLTEKKFKKKKKKNNKGLSIQIPV